MADFDSSLPVRTEAAGDVAVKIVDATVTSQQLVVEADGSINVNAAFAAGTKVEITDGVDDLAINADGSLNATVTATDLDIRDLSSAQDSVSVLQATHDNLNANANIQVGNADVGNANPVPVSDAGGSITVDAADLDIRDLAFATDSVDVSGSAVTATVSATDLDIRDLAFATDSVDVSGSAVTVSATDLDIRDLAFATDSVDVSGSDVTATVTATDLDIRDLSSATDSVTVVASDLDIRDLSSATDSVTVLATDLDVRDLDAAQDSVAISDGTDQLEINSDGSINVVVQEDAGLEIVNYDTTASVAGGASDNHDWTSAAASRLFQVLASASGKLKVEVQVETAAASGVFNTVAVAFNSTANPNIDLDLRKFAVVPNGARVRVIRTNRDNQAQDVYSTIVAIQG